MAMFSTWWAISETFGRKRMQHYARREARFGRRGESININFGLVFPPVLLPPLSLFSDSVSLIPMPAAAAASLAPIRISNLLALAIRTSLFPLGTEKRRTCIALPSAFGIERPCLALQSLPSRIPPKGCTHAGRLRVSYRAALK